MIRALWAKVTPFFERGEKFVVVEILRDLVRVSSVKANFERRKVRFLAVREEPNELADELATFARLSRLLRRVPGSAKRRAIVLLDSSLATTVHAPIALIRPHPQEPIDEPDLENRIAQAIWKLFDRERSRAADKMRTGQLNVILTDVRVRRIRLDGNRVVNPMGFKAKVIEVHLTETFSSKQFTERLREFIPGKRIAYLGESGVAVAEAIARSREAEEFVLAAVSRNETACYAARGSAVCHADSFAWGWGNLVRAVAAAFSVSEPVAEALLGRYRLRAVSPHLFRRFSDLVMGELTLLARGIEAVLKREDARRAYLLPGFELPDLAFSPAFSRRFSERVRIGAAHHDALAGELGFSVEMAPRASIGNAAGPFAGLLAFYFSPPNDTIDRIAKRHARWLIHER